MHEVATAFAHEEWKISRKRAATYVTAGCIVLGVLASLSFGVLNDYQIMGLNFFNLLDTFTSSILLPLGGMLISIFTGWYLDKKIVWQELSNDGTLKVHYYKLFIFILKYVAPLGIGLVFIHELGFLF